MITKPTKGDARFKRWSSNKVVFWTVEKFTRGAIIKHTWQHATVMLCNNPRRFPERFGFPSPRNDERGRGSLRYSSLALSFRFLTCSSSKTIRRAIWKIVSLAPSSIFTWSLHLLDQDWSWERATSSSFSTNAFRHRQRRDHVRALPFWSASLTLDRRHAYLHTRTSCVISSLVCLPDEMALRHVFEQENGSFARVNTTT